MSSIKIGIVIYAIFCLGLQLNAEERIKTEHKYFPNARIFFAPKNFDLGPNYIFAACHIDEIKGKEVNCTIFSNKFHNQNTCNITIKPKFDGPISNFVMFSSLNKDANKAIVSVQEVTDNKKTNSKQAQHLIIIDFHENSCSTKETMVFSDNKHVQGVNIIPHGDKFDVIYENPAQCGDKHFCRIRFDTNNLSIEKLNHCVIPNGRGIESVWNYLIPIENGFFYQSSRVYVNHRSYHNIFGLYKFINIVNNQGGIKVIKIIDTVIEKGRTSSLSFSSVKDKIIEIAFINCLEFLNTTEINFLKFDQDGKSISEQLVKVKNHRFKDIVKHNLKGGGFLIAGYENDHNDHTNYHTIKFDDKGNQIGSTELKGFTCDGNGRTRYLTFYNNDRYETCILMVCYDMLHAEAIELGHVDSYRMCFEDEDFSN